MHINSDDALAHLIDILSPSNVARSLQTLIVDFHLVRPPPRCNPSTKWIDLKDLLLGFVRLEAIHIKCSLSSSDSNESWFKNIFNTFISRGALHLNGRRCSL
jgi:hypothetical protein